jgi:hypothetical protein
MATTRKILEQMRREPTNVRFSDLMKICEEHFGKPIALHTTHIA